MITKKYYFSISTNKIGSETSDEVELQFDDDLTDEEIEKQVTEIYTGWLFENNYGGFNEINNNG